MLVLHWKRFLGDKETFDIPVPFLKSAGEDYKKSGTAWEATISRLFQSSSQLSVLFNGK